jgi:hypothetical protein
MTLLDPRPDMCSAQREKSKKGKKWFTLSLFTKSMSLILGVKDFWLFLQETPEKSNKKLFNYNKR